MADLPPGARPSASCSSTPRQQFTGLGVLTSDQAKRRAQVVAASLAPPSETSIDNAAADAPPMLIGWIADAGEPLVQPGRTATGSRRSRW